MNKLPNGWIETTLGKITKIKGGKRLPKGKTLVLGKTKHPYIRITDLENNSIKKSKLQFVTDEIFPEISRYIVHEGDIILSIVGTIGLVAKIDADLDNANLTENCVKFTDLTNLNPNFLYYYLISRIGQHEINSNSVGAVQKKLPIYGIQNINIIIPSLNEQKAIAKILSSLDEKIELLKEQNNTLEKLAQTIFKESFNQNKKIKKIMLSEMVKIKYGKDHKHLQDGKYPLYGSGGIMRCVENFLYNKESILIPRKGTISNLFFLTKPFWSVDTIFYTEIDELKVIPIYLFYALKKINLSNFDVGSAVPSLTTKVLNSLEIEIPSLKDQADTAKLLYSINDKILFNISQIQTISKTRDTLLPKLMTGEIRIQGFGE